MYVFDLDFSRYVSVEPISSYEWRKVYDVCSVPFCAHFLYCFFSLQKRNKSLLFTSVVSQMNAHSQTRAAERKKTRNRK